MAESRLVPSNLMAWPKIKTLVPDLKLLVYHLWATSPSSAGAWLLDLGAIASATNLNEVAIMDALNDFEVRNISLFDKETGEIFILDWYRFHKFSKKFQKDCLVRDMQKIQSLCIKNAVLSKIKDLNANQTELNSTQLPPTPLAKQSVQAALSGLNEEEEMLAAILHCHTKVRGFKIESISGFCMAIRGRLKREGPTAQDLEDLEIYKGLMHMEAA